MGSTPTVFWAFSVNDVIELWDASFFFPVSYPIFHC